MNKIPFTAMFTTIGVGEVMEMVGIWKGNLEVQIVPEIHGPTCPPTIRLIMMIKL